MKKLSAVPLFLVVGLTAASTHATIMLPGACFCPPDTIWELPRHLCADLVGPFPLNCCYPNHRSARFCLGPLA